MNPLTEKVIELAAEVQRFKIQIDLMCLQAQSAMRGGQPLSAGANPAAFPGPSPTPVDGVLSSIHPPASNEIERLVELFDTFGGFVPGFEFEAAGFDIADLMLRRLIAPPMSHMDGGCYLIGSELRKAVHRG